MQNIVHRAQGFSVLGLSSSDVWRFWFVSSGYPTMCQFFHHFQRFFTVSLKYVVHSLFFIANLAHFSSHSLWQLFMSLSLRHLSFWFITLYRASFCFRRVGQLIICHYDFWPLSSDCNQHITWRATGVLGKFATSIRNDTFSRISYIPSAESILYGGLFVCMPSMVTTTLSKVTWIKGYFFFYRILTALWPKSSHVPVIQE